MTRRWYSKHEGLAAGHRVQSERGGSALQDEDQYEEDQDHDHIGKEEPEQIRITINENTLEQVHQF